MYFQEPEKRVYQTNSRVHHKMDLKIHLDGLKQIIESARSKTNIDISGVSNYIDRNSVHFVSIQIHTEAI